MPTEKQPTSQSSVSQSASDSTPDQSDQTQMGQVIEGLGRLTRRWPTARRRRDRARDRDAPVPSRDRMLELIDALGASQSPLHAEAVDALIAVGAPAVPLLNEALSGQRPWLAAYRAAEALGQIGDGRATGALIAALQHPNSNVRWSVVQALAQLGDVRALLELRRVAQSDQGRTSWGESVSGAAQSALDEIRNRSVWSQSVELFKTAVVTVLMILALVLAFSVVTTLRDEFDRLGVVAPGVVNVRVRTPLPTREPTSAPAAVAVPSLTVETPAVAPSVVTATAQVTGTALQDANVRPSPDINNEPVGKVQRGDEVIFVARTVDGQWYRVRLGERYTDGSWINNPDGSASGWVNQALLSPPTGSVPVEDSPTPTPADIFATPTP